jgi:hypothetical protein
MALSDASAQADHRAARASAGRRSEVRHHLRDALWLLLQAYEYAEELDQDVWSFAVELHALRAAHLTTSDLRWLACKYYVEHASETTKPQDTRRHFRRTGPATFVDETCVVLTPAGLALAREICAEGATIAAPRPRTATSRSSITSTRIGRPKWDRDRRQVRFDGRIVKEFKLPSPNQEAVLMAFEEEGWPARIDDPLMPTANLDPRRRLHDTIKALNRNQKENLLRFMGDGTGEGIRWEPVLETQTAVLTISPD